MSAAAARGLIQLAGKFLGKGGLAKLGGARGVRQLATDAGTSAVLNTGGSIAIDLMSGQPVDVGGALTYGLVDGLVSGAASGGRRLLGKGRLTRTQKQVANPGRTKSQKDLLKKDPKAQITVSELNRRGGENIANIGASLFVTPGIVGALRGQQISSAQGINNAQPNQVTQQQIQRAAINSDPALLAGAYAPYTNFLNTGSPSNAAQVDQYLTDAGLGVQNDPAFAANAVKILGL